MRKPGTPAKAISCVRGVLSPVPWSCLVDTDGLDVKGRNGDDDVDCVVLLLRIES